MNVVEPNSPPVWHLWAQIFWAVFIAVGAALEIYAAFFDPGTPTFTGMVKRYVPWPIVRAGVMGALFYHFCVQPLYETLQKMGIKVF